MSKWWVGLVGLQALVLGGAACGTTRDEPFPGPSASSATAGGAGGTSGAGGDGSSSVTLTGAGGGGGTGPGTKFFLLVAQTPAGSPPMSQWGGILRYDFAGDGAPATIGPAIDKSLVHDPLGLAFRKKSAEVFVGNRHGNTGEDGVTGSVSRFLYDAATESFKPNGEITGNGMGAISGVAFNAAEDELFAANCCNGGNGITRFKLDAKGVATPNGAIPDTSLMQGLAVSPDGKRLYATGGGSATGQVVSYELPSGKTLGSLTIPGASALHHITRSGNELYIGDVAAGVVRVRIEPNDDLTFVEIIASHNPLSVVLSPDGLELFATAHQFEASSIIDRFVPSGTAWKPTTTIVTPASNGGTLAFSAAAVPEPL